MSEVEQDGDQGGHLFRLVIAGVGLVQGFGFFVLAEINWTVQALWPMAAATFCLLAPSTFQLTFRLGPIRRALASALGFAVLMTLLALWLDWRVATHGEDGFDDHRDVFFCTLPIVAYIGWAVLQTWTERGDLAFPYERLFHFAWSNILIAAVSAAFLGVFWLVLVLWWSLFDLIGIRFFKELFQESVFAWVFSGAVFGLGIAISRENGKLVPVLRRVVLMLFQILAPVLAAAALMFLVMLPFTGLQVLWDTKAATLVLVCLLLALTLFVNAVVQDGDRPVPFGRWMNWLMMATLLAMPLFAAIAIYAVRLRIGQYGLTPERFIGQLVVFVAAALALAYAVGVVWKRQAWPGFITMVNPWLAALVMALALLMLTPAADPYGWSARAQVARLLDGKVEAEKFDFAYLKFRLGKPGQAAFDRLREVKGQPEQAMIDARIAEADKAKSYWEAQDTPNMVRPGDLATIRANLLVRPDNSTVPDEVTKTLNDQRGWSMKECLDGDGQCGVFVADLNGDGQPEYLFLSRAYALSGLLVYRDGESWSIRDTVVTLHAGSGGKEEVWAAFLAGDIELVQPEYYDIRIGKNRLHY
ncbi:MAG: hypothetical protein AB7O49_20125 [Sphingomonadales bacterium]